MDVWYICAVVALTAALGIGLYFAPTRWRVAVATLTSVGLTAFVLRALRAPRRDVPRGEAPTLDVKDNYVLPPSLEERGEDHAADRPSGVDISGTVIDYADQSERARQRLEARIRDRGI